MKKNRGREEEEVLSEMASVWGVKGNARKKSVFDFQGFLGLISFGFLVS